MLKRTLLLATLLVSITRITLADDPTESERKRPAREAPDASALTSVEVTQNDDGTLKREERTVGGTEEASEPAPTQTSHESAQPQPLADQSTRTTPGGMALAILGAGAVLAVLRGRTGKERLAIVAVAVLLSGAAFVLLSPVSAPTGSAPEPLHRATVLGK